MNCSECCASVRGFATETVPATLVAVKKTAIERATNLKEWALDNKGLAAGGVACMLATAALCYFVGMSLIPTLTLSLISTPFLYAAQVNTFKDNSDRAIPLAIATLCGFASQGFVPFLFAGTVVTIDFFNGV